MAPPKLKTSDHTDVMTFALENLVAIDGAGPLPAAQRFNVLAGLAKGTPHQRTFNRVKNGMADLNQDLTANFAANKDAAKYWNEGLSVLARVLAFDGNEVEEYQSLLLREARQSSEAIRIGLETVADLLGDGADTIYDGGAWVVNMWIDPRGLLSQAGNALGEIAGKVKGVLAGDAKGGVVGAVSGAAGGAVRGGIAGGPAGVAGGAAAGAAVGAVSGAVAGSLNAL
jgi:hypothetical protein